MSGTIQEIHGVRATKMQAGPAEYAMPVTVWDDYSMIVLKLDGVTYPAGMTADEARLLARFLTAAADRLELRNRRGTKP